MEPAKPMTETMQPDKGRSKPT